MDASQRQVAQHALGQLVGLTMRDGKRAADMKMFGFGDDVVVMVGPKNARRVIAQRMLHLQCPWRLLAGDLEIASHSDWRKRRPGQSIEDVDAGIVALLDRTPVVASADINDSGDVSVICENGIVLVVTPDEEAGEQWRVLQFNPADSGEAVGRGGLHVVLDRVDGELIVTVE